jgi:hypothetical protein
MPLRAAKPTKEQQAEEHQNNGNILILHVACTRSECPYRRHQIFLGVERRLPDSLASGLEVLFLCEPGGRGRPLGYLKARSTNLTFDPETLRRTWGHGFLLLNQRAQMLLQQLDWNVAETCVRRGLHRGRVVGEGIKGEGSVDRARSKDSPLHTACVSFAIQEGLRASLTELARAAAAALRPT